MGQQVVIRQGFYKRTDMVAVCNKNLEWTTNADKTNTVSVIRGRFTSRMGMCVLRQACKWPMECTAQKSKLQLSRNDGSAFRATIVPKIPVWTNGTNPVRQCDNNGLCKPSWWTRETTDRSSTKYLVSSISQQDSSDLQTHIGYNKYNSRLEVRSQSVSTDRQLVLSSHGRPICKLYKQAVASLQQSILPPTIIRHRRTGPFRLETTHKLRKSSIQIINKSIASHNGSEGDSNSNRPLLEGQPWLAQLKRMSVAPPIMLPNSPFLFHQMRPIPKPLKKTEVENICLESLRSDHLKLKGWSKRATEPFIHRWANNTLRMYNSYISKCLKFCETNKLDFSIIDSKDIAEFFAIRQTLLKN